MSLLALPLASLFFAGSAVAQTAPVCSQTWNWTSNSLGQDPCVITANLMSTCGVTITIEPLAAGGKYGGPSGGSNDINLCMCNTVIYSLLSACAGCQGGNWSTWSQYAYNCTESPSVRSFPNPVPSGTRVPQWALLDVTNENAWDFNKSYAAGDFPEIYSGSIISSNSSVYVNSILNTATLNTATLNMATSNTATWNTATLHTVATSNTVTSNKATSNTATPSPIGVHRSNLGGLAGGVVGGMAAISIIASMLYLHRRRCLLALPKDFDVFNPALGLSSVSNVRSRDGYSVSPDDLQRGLTKPYNPDDPTTTFPDCRGAPNLLCIPLNYLIYHPT